MEALNIAAEITLAAGFCLMAANFPLRLISKEWGNVGVWLVGIAAVEGLLLDAYPWIVNALAD